MDFRQVLYYLLIVLATANPSSFSFGATLIPHPDKVKKGGEDAYLATPYLLIVSDGVGGWAEQGINSGEFSRALCNNAYIAWRRSPEYYSTRPQELMEMSVKNNLKDGSATMTIVTMDKTGRVHSANLGDSGYMWIRRSRNGVFQVVFHTKQQQHSFNYPYQLASPKSKITKGDSPYDSITSSHIVQNGDFILLGSDGLFDNLFMKDILNLLRQYGTYDRYGQMTNKEQVSRILAQRAINLGKNISYYSPFTANAKQRGLKGQDFLGGKLDDTTVIIAQVNSNFNNQNRQSAVSSAFLDSGRVNQKISQNLAQRLFSNFGPK